MSVEFNKTFEEYSKKFDETFKSYSKKFDETFESCSKCLHINLKKGVNKVSEFCQKEMKIPIVDGQKKLAVFELKLFLLNATTFALITYTALVVLRLMAPSISLTIQLVGLLALRQVANRSIKHEKNKITFDQARLPTMEFLNYVLPESLRIHFKSVDGEKVYVVFRASPIFTALVRREKVGTRYYVIEKPIETALQ